MAQFETIFKTLEITDKLNELAFKNINNVHVEKPKHSDKFHENFDQSFKNNSDSITCLICGKPHLTVNCLNFLL